MLDHAGEIDVRLDRGNAEGAGLAHGLGAGPPLIGMTADHIGLAGGLSVVVVAAVVLLLFSRMARSADD